MRTLILKWKKSKPNNKRFNYCLIFNQNKNAQFIIQTWLFHFYFSAGAESGETDSREELQRLYAQLENWRLSEEKRIMTTTRQASRLRSQRAKLVTDEALKLAQLATKRDKNKLAHKQDIVKSIILKVSIILI